MLTKKVLMLDNLLQQGSSSIRESREPYITSEGMDEPPFPFLLEDYV